MLLYEGFNKKERIQKKPKKNLPKLIDMDTGKVSEDLKLQITKVKKLAQSKDIDNAKKEFRRVITILYRKKSDDIGNEVVSVFEVVRMAIVIGLPFCIHPALGLVSYIVDKVISEKVNEKSEKRVMSNIQRSLDLCDEKLKKENISNEEKKQLEDMKKVLKSKKNNLENYYMEIKQYKYTSADSSEYEYEDPNDDFSW